MLRQSKLPASWMSRTNANRRGSASGGSPQNTSNESTTKTSSSSHSSTSAPQMDERDTLRLLAQETLAIVSRGVYSSPSGQIIHIRQIVESSMRGTLFYHPQAFDNWENHRPAFNPIQTHFSCTERTTLQAAYEFATQTRQLAAQTRSTPSRIGVLNFAVRCSLSTKPSALMQHLPSQSATKPGGGFKNGAKAQEESIARVSALYASLTTPTGLEFYKREARSRQGPTYSDAMVYSPRVLVFNTDERILLDDPYEISLVTSPAVNAGEVRDQNRHQDEGKVERAIARIVSFSLVLSAVKC